MEIIEKAEKKQMFEVVWEEYVDRYGNPTAFGELVERVALVEDGTLEGFLQWVKYLRSTRDDSVRWGMVVEYEQQTRP